MKRKLLLIVAILIITSSFYACGSSGAMSSYSPSASSTATANSVQRDYGAMTQASPEIAMESPAMGGSDAYNDNPATAGGGKSSADSMLAMINTSNRLIVRTVNLTLETVEFDTSVDGIEEMVLGYGGFIENSYVQGKSMYDRYGRRSANFTARIPAEKLDAFINDIGGIFNVIDKQQSGSDITDSYYDTDARLNSLKTQEERLLAMLEQAGELEYLLQVERELANVRYEIESLTSSLLRMKNQVSMSTVYLQIEETIEYTPVEPEPVTFVDKLGHAFTGSIETFKNFAQGAVITLIWAFPFLIFMGAVAVVVILLSVSARKKRKKRFEAVSIASKAEPPQDNGDDSSQN